jgi:hypothetical protein
VSLIVTTCVAPKCKAHATTGPFCVVHATAPATQRGGWISSANRMTKTGQPIDANSVGPRLWVGARPPFDRDIPKVNVIVLCAREIQPTKDQIAFKGQLMHCPLPDAELTNDQLRLAIATSRNIVKALLEEKRVLVTCAAGINRSAFVAALTLGQLTLMSADQLIARMRRLRHPECLYNQYFQSYLHSLIGDGRDKKQPQRRR